MSLFGSNAFPLKTAVDRSRLQPAKPYGPVHQRFLSLLAQFAVVRVVRKVGGHVHFCRGTEFEKIKLTNRFRPASARIVGQPETVGAEEEVICEYHFIYHREKSRRFMCARSVATCRVYFLHVLNNRFPKLATFQLRRAFHHAVKIVGNRFGGDGAVHAFDD